jgi:serine/threonine protein kinase/tetratricopeptide (TPR) repeat protein
MSSDANGMMELRDRLRSALADRYGVDREVGRGGMATVYLAQDLKHGRQVALKVLHPELAVTLGSERFLREIRIAARLQHPHILPLYDSGQADELLYYVMPFVEGESLRDRLNRDGQLPVEEAVRIARDMAAALDYAHRHGVVHRDIKPENVMLHEGEATVTDFGIAKAVSAAGGENLTATGMAVGTPAYMSPEQATGEEPDGRTDIYSLGCVLYEMLTGEAPFSAPTVQALIMKRLTDPVPSARTTRPVITAELDLVVRKALAKEPDERFSSGAQLVQALGSPKVVTPHATPLATPTVTPPAKSIAVLPFVDMSPQKDQDYFCEGIAEEIINALTKIQALRVISRSSAFAFKGQNQDIRKVGEQLNVGTVLEGSIRKAGNRLRITAQLISVAGGHHLWSDRYDRELEDVFAIQDEIATSIVKALRVVLSEDEKRAIEKAGPVNIQAYDFYLRGRQFFHQWRRKSVEQARRLFERAIEIEPGYALAHAGVAMCCAYIYDFWDASAANLQMANTASRTALELDPKLAEAHWARGVALAIAKQYTEANAAFEQSIRLEPNLVEAHHFYARALLQQGDRPRAADEFRAATRLRPEDYQPLLFLSQVLEDPAEAEAVRQSALVALERHLEFNPDDPRALNLGGILAAQCGQADKGMEWTRRALASSPDDSNLLYNVACFYAVQGQSNEALDCLEKAVENGWRARDWLTHDPDMDSLRSDPRYQALVNRL